MERFSRIIDLCLDIFPSQSIISLKYLIQSIALNTQNKPFQIKQIKRFNQFKIYRQQDKKHYFYIYKKSKQSIKYMLDNKGLQKLYETLNSEDETLEQIQSDFLSKFNDSLSVFKASYALSNLLNLNLLTNRQRIIALFLLIENFKYEGIKRHPFGATILNISSITTEPFERKMIADMIIDMKRQKYSKIKIEALYQEQQSILDPIEQKPELKKIREEFIANLPKISQSKKSSVKNVIPDFNEKDKKLYPPQTQPNLNTIKESDINNDSFNVGFMRPIPKFIDIHASELNWLSPGIITDVHWDNSAEIQRKLTKAKALIKKAAQQHISKQECTEIQRALQIQPYAVLNLGVTPQMFMQIVKNNSYIAVAFITKMSNYPAVGDYLEAFIEPPLTMNALDVFARLHKIVKIHHDLTLSFSLFVMKDIQQRPESDKDRNKLAKLAAQFLKSFIKNSALDFRNYFDDLEEFINTFLNIEEIASLKKSIIQGQKD